MQIINNVASALRTPATAELNGNVFALTDLRSDAPPIPLSSAVGCRKIEFVLL